MWQDHLRHVSVYFPILFYLFCAPTTPETKTNSVNNVSASIKPKKKQQNNTYSLKYIFIIIHGVICKFFYYLSSQDYEGMSLLGLEGHV